MVDQEKRNFYKILGIERTASQDDIKKAYRKAALENHPDRNPDKANADSRIKEINAAYETLGDEKKRKEYDLQGRSPFGANGGCFKNGGHPFRRQDHAQTFFNQFFTERPGGPFGGAGHRGPFGDPFTNPFTHKPSPMDIDDDFLRAGLGGFNKSRNPNCSQQRKRQRTESFKKGETVEYDLCTTLEDLYNGKKKKMKINRRRKQPDGRYKDENTVLTIDIKQGWKEGTKITFHNEGSEKPGISAGDVVFKIKEITHAMFKRDGNDLELVQEVSLHQALSGGTAKIPLLDQSEYVLHFDNLTTTASTMRLKGKGMPISKTPGQFGDLVIKFEVALPTGRSRQNIAKILAS